MNSLDVLGVRAVLAPPGDLNTITIPDLGKRVTPKRTESQAMKDGFGSVFELIVIPISDMTPTGTRQGSTSGIKRPMVERMKLTKVKLAIRVKFQC